MDVVGAEREARARVVLELVAACSGINLEVLRGPSRSPAIAQVRRAALDLLRTDAGFSPDTPATCWGAARPRVRHLGRRSARGEPAGGLTATIRQVLGSGAGDAPPGEWTACALPALVTHRQAVGLSRPELAARAGIARETLSRIEHGRPASPATILRLAAALGLPPRVLTGEVSVSLRAAGRPRR